MVSQAKKGLLYTAIMASALGACTPNYSAMERDLNSKINNSRVYQEMTRKPVVAEEKTVPTPMEEAPAGAVTLRPKATEYLIESLGSVKDLEGIAYFNTFNKGFNAEDCSFTRGLVGEERKDGYDKNLDLLLDRSIPKSQRTAAKPYFSDKAVDAIVVRECASANATVKEVPAASLVEDGKKSDYTGEKPKSDKKTVEPPVAKTKEKKADEVETTVVSVYSFQEGAENFINGRIENFTAAYMMMHPLTDKVALGTAIPIVADSKGRYDLTNCIGNLKPDKSDKRYSEIRDRVLGFVDTLSGLKPNQDSTLVGPKRNGKKDQKITVKEVKFAETYYCHRVAKVLKKGPYAKK